MAVILKPSTVNNGASVIYRNNLTNVMFSSTVGLFDIINEYTTGNGVYIDGVHIKDGDILIGAGGGSSDLIIAATTDGDLTLSGNGTGNVVIGLDGDVTRRIKVNTIVPNDGDTNVNLNGTIIGSTSILTGRVLLTDRIAPSTSGGDIIFQNNVSVTSTDSVGGVDNITTASVVTTSVSAATLNVSSELSVPSLLERTSGSGVTVDGVLFKDSGCVLPGNVYTDIITGSPTVNIDGVVFNNGSVSISSATVTNINERTADSGVTIDGVLVKDGALSVTANLNVDVINEVMTDQGVVIDGVVFKDGDIQASGLARVVNIDEAIASNGISVGHSLYISRINAAFGNLSIQGVTINDDELSSFTSMTGGSYLETSEAAATNILYATYFFPYATSGVTINSKLFTTAGVEFDELTATTEVKTNTVTEYTTDNGVDIQSTKLKDSGVTITGTLYTPSILGNNTPLTSIESVKFDNGNMYTVTKTTSIVTEYMLGGFSDPADGVVTVKQVGKRYYISLRISSITVTGTGRIFFGTWFPNVTALTGLIGAYASNAYVRIPGSVTRLLDGAVIDWSENSVNRYGAFFHNPSFTGANAYAELNMVLESA